MHFLKNNITNYSVLLLISLLTLGGYDHNFYPSIDGSYFWAPNFFAAFRSSDLDKTTFIYGPLSFLRTPECYGHLILWGYLFQVAAKFLYGWQLLRLSDILHFPKRMAFLLVLLISLVTFSADVFVQLPVILFLVLHFFEQKVLYLVCASAITALGYYIKSSDGLTGLLIQAVYTGTLLISKRMSFRTALLIPALNLVSIVTLGLVVYRRFGAVTDSFVIYYHNIIAYNETSSTYNFPDNFFLLGLFAAGLVTVLLLKGSPGFRLFWLMSLVMLYSAYTHGMVRMDYAHYTGLITFFLCVLVTMGVFYKEVSPYGYPVAILSLFCYYANLWNKYDYYDYSLAIPNGPRTICRQLVNYDRYRQDCYNNSMGNLATSGVKINDDSIITQLKKGSVDFFPWDLLFVEANGFTNWRPRPTLQSLNMSPYFDKRTAAYYNSEWAPEHLVWHSCTYDSVFFHSFDDSYFLTNEFHSCLSILCNYKVLKHSDKHLYLEKRRTPLAAVSTDLSLPLKVSNGEWIKTPDSPDITGCTLEFDFNLLRSLKKLCYRDDEFFIEYKTADSAIIKRRFWPSDAKDMIWISPYIETPFNPASYKKVTAVRFSNTTGNRIHSGTLKLRFRSVKIPGMGDSLGTKGLYGWFNP